MKDYFEQNLLQSMGLESMTEDVQTASGMDVDIDINIADTTTNEDDYNSALAAMDASDSAEATLESLISQLSIRLANNTASTDYLAGANLALESVAHSLKLSPQYLCVALEDGTDDPVAETQGFKARAKEVLTSIKNQTAALVTKMLLSASAFLGNLSAMATKTLNKAQALKQQAANAETKEGTVEADRGMRAYLTVDGSPLSSQEYINNLDRTFEVINNVMDVTGDNEAFSAFIGISGAAAEGKDARLGIKEVAKYTDRIASTITKPISVDDTNFGFSPDPYAEYRTSDKLLGGISFISSSLKEVETQKYFKEIDEILAKLPKYLPEQDNISSEKFSDEEISMEDMTSFVGKGMSKMLRLLALLTLSIGFVGNVGIRMLTLYRGFVKPVMNRIKAGGAMGPDEFGKRSAISSLTGKILAIVLYKVCKGTSNVLKGAADRIDYALLKRELKDVNVAKILNGVTVKDVVAASREIYVEHNYRVQMDGKAELQALNKQQIEHVIDVVTRNATAIRAYGKNINARKQLIDKYNKSYSQLTTAASTEKAEPEIIANLNRFVSTGLKQAVKLEIATLKQAINVMNAGIKYCENSLAS